jgi:hypothetical protein
MKCELKFPSFVKKKKKLVFVLNFHYTAPLKWKKKKKKKI